MELKWPIIKVTSYRNLKERAEGVLTADELREAWLGLGLGEIGIFNCSKLRCAVTELSMQSGLRCLNIFRAQSC